MTTTHLNGLSREALKSLCDQPGPTVSVYLRRGHEPGDQGSETRLRWRRLHDTLAEQHARAADVSAVEAVAGDAISDARFGDQVLAIFASGGHVVASFELDSCEEPDGAVVGRWPHLEPLLRWQQQHAPHVVAVVDRTGGYLTGYAADGSVVQAETVTGPDDEIERNNPGGWSQGRYQRRAEDSWAHNAAAVGRRLTTMSDNMAALAIIVAGDVRAVQMLIDSLPDRLQKSVVIAPDGSLGHADGHLRVDPAARAAIVGGAATEAHRGRLEGFDDAVGARRAVEGAADVRAALDQGAVKELFIVHGEAAPELEDALVAAAVAEDSDVLVLQPDEVTLVGGVGATLRF